MLAKAHEINLHVNFFISEKCRIYHLLRCAHQQNAD